MVTTRTINKNVIDGSLFTWHEQSRSTTGS